MDLPSARLLELGFERLLDRVVAGPPFVGVRADSENTSFTGDQALKGAHISCCHGLVEAEHGVSDFG